MKHEPCTNLLDHVMNMYTLKRDADLARFLDVPPPIVSNWRSGRLSFGPSYIIKLHEKTAMSIAAIKALLPDAVAKKG